MNSKQRRTARRKQGVKGPYRCLWCDTVNQGIGYCDGCGEHIKPIGEVTLKDLGKKAHRRGHHLHMRIRPSEEPWRPGDTEGEQLMFLTRTTIGPFVTQYAESLQGLTGGEDE